MVFRHFKTLCSGNYLFCKSLLYNHVSEATCCKRSQADRLRTDYELASAFEHDLCLQEWDRVGEVPVSTTYPNSYSSPLVGFQKEFKEIHVQLNLTYTAASILDDLRSLTLSILALPSTYCDGATDCTETAKSIQSHASQIHLRFLAQSDTRSSPPPCKPSSTEIITTIIRITALAYTSCISNGNLFNDAYSISSRTELYHLISLIPLETWKKIPGIFLWILMVACPGSRSHAPFLLRSHISATSLYISFTDFGLAVGCWNAFWRIQMWIRRRGGDGELVEDNSGLSRNLGAHDLWLLSGTYD